MKNLLRAILENHVTHYLLRLNRNVNDDYIGLLAAGVAFYFFLAAFPAIAALISLYGLFADPMFITDQLHYLSRFMPPESLKILADQARSIESSDGTALGLGFAISIILTIYSTTKGVSALMKGLNITYNERERRNILILNSTAFTLTFIMITYMLFSLSLVALMPAFFQIIHIPESAADRLLTLRWPILMACGVFGLQILYNYGPCHAKKDRHFLSWGAVIAAALWLIGSYLFSLFISNFNEYNETYGSLGAVAVLLLWFWLNAITILFGAEVNAAFERIETKSRRAD